MGYQDSNGNVHVLDVVFCWQASWTYVQSGHGYSGIRVKRYWMGIAAARFSWNEIRHNKAASPAMVDYILLSTFGRFLFTFFSEEGNLKPLKKWKLFYNVEHLEAAEQWTGEKVGRIIIVHYCDSKGMKREIFKRGNKRNVINFSKMDGAMTSHVTCFWGKSIYSMRDLWWYYCLQRTVVWKRSIQLEAPQSQKWLNVKGKRLEMYQLLFDAKPLTARKGTEIMCLQCSRRSLCSKIMMRWHWRTAPWDGIFSSNHEVEPVMRLMAKNAQLWRSTKRSWLEQY